MASSPRRARRNLARVLQPDLRENASVEAMKIRVTELRRSGEADDGVEWAGGFSTAVLAMGAVSGGSGFWYRTKLGLILAGEFTLAATRI